jgi:hypothetical protein
MRQTSAKRARAALAACLALLALAAPAAARRAQLQAAPELGAAPDGSPCATPCTDGTCRLETGRVAACSAPGAAPAAGAAPPVAAPAPAAPAALGTAADGSPCATACETSAAGRLTCRLETGRVAACTAAGGALPVVDIGRLAEEGAPAPPAPAADPAAPAAPAPVADPAGPAPATPLDVARVGSLPLCAPAPVPGLVTAAPAACGAGAVCAPLAAAQLASALGADAAALAGRVGACAFAPHPLLLPDPAAVPPPLAFFPLTAPAIESFPLGEFRGEVAGATIAPDARFGAALRCRQGDQDVVALDAVPYGASTGAFSINIWARPADLAGGNFSYVLSHRGAAPGAAAAQAGWGPNQIQLFYPESGHPAFGVARAFVRDADDADRGAASAAFLDSDGRVAFNDARPPPYPLLDGGWHMLTLTTRPGGGDGYRLYADGALAAELNATAAIGPDGAPLEVGGGGPLRLEGDLVLCSRSDDPEGRHFDGDLAYLSLWDEALSPEAVAALYAAVADAPAAAAAPAAGAEAAARSTRPGAPPAARTAVSGRACVFPALHNGKLVNDCVLIAGAPFCQTGGEDFEPCAELGAAAAVAPPPPRGAEEPQLVSLPEEQPLGDYAEEALVGGPPSAESAESGTGRLGAPDPAQAAPAPARAPVFSADGRLCELPLRYGPVTIESCASVGGDWACWPAGGAAWAPCAPGRADAGADAAAAAAPTGAGADTVPLFALPRRARRTADGRACALPAVFEGAVVDDCVEARGQLACPVAGGEWAACDAVSARTGGVTAGLEVAARETAGGDACLLPAVTGGQLYFNCPDAVAAAGGLSPACPTATGRWEVCAPAGAEAATAPLNVTAAALGARGAPAGDGALCALNATAARAPAAAACASNLSCVPLPVLLPAAAAQPAYDPLAGAGFCAPGAPAAAATPAFAALAAAAAPQPAAYFPLVDGQLSAVTLPPYAGAALGAGPLAWIDDDAFGSVPACSRAARTALCESSCVLGRPVEAENILETNQPTNQPTTNYRPLPQNKLQRSPTSPTAPTAPSPSPSGRAARPAPTPRASLSSTSSTTRRRPRPATRPASRPTRSASTSRKLPTRRRAPCARWLSTPTTRAARRGSTRTASRPQAPTSRSARPAAARRSRPSTTAAGTWSR